MNTTRNTINIARAVAALAAITVYFVSGAFYDVLLRAENPYWLLSVLGVCSALWVFDTFHRSRADYILRMGVLGAGYGFLASSAAVLAAGYLL
ncbi:MAG: hypothetical protein E6R04_02960 [Spirochaetes bacterium]|nr:MAG: hypothetical protein E6R04_02960 [Spirochaetota bacterium]